jgi:hypothetical protein
MILTASALAYAFTNFVTKDALHDLIVARLDRIEHKLDCSINHDMCAQ